MLFYVPHGEGFFAIRKALDERGTHDVATDTLVTLASIVLENNYFKFHEKIYRQKLGTVIGTKFAPACANIFMAQLEQILLNSWGDKPWVWLRYIDNVFFFWTHGEEKLRQFISYLNGSHETITFYSESSRDRISYLDVLVKQDRKGGLDTDLFYKDTDTHQFLHNKSCHPRFCVILSDYFYYPRDFTYACLFVTHV